MIKEKSKAKIYYENGKPFLKISPLYCEYMNTQKKKDSKKVENFSLREKAIINYVLKNFPHTCYDMNEKNMLKFKSLIPVFNLNKYKKINNFNN